MVGLLPKPGKYRRVNVHVRDSKFAPPDWSEVPKLMVSFIKNLNSDLKKGTTISV